MMKGVDERIDEGVLRWFGYVERMENDRIVKRECVGRVRKRWFDTVGLVNTTTVFLVFIYKKDIYSLIVQEKIISSCCGWMRCTSDLGRSAE